ncbi:hypothetical protein [Glutamicibacter sp. NPDC087344]|uniref:hypothetical protein n=1 Tax=Glutamicibacter sp. NPDC087344 TaxID=3363994 RepID=UPI003800C460
MALETVRSSAAKWHAGLSGLLGGVFIASGVGLRSTLAELAHPWPVIVAPLLLVALGTAFAGLYLALHAAGGAPRLISTARWRDNDGHLAAAKAVRQLRMARWLTALSIAAFLIALLTTWFAPPRTELVLVDTVGTEQFCGEAELTDSLLIVADSAGAVRVFPLETLARWQSVDSCPTP